MSLEQSAMPTRAGAARVLGVELERLGMPVRALGTDDILEIAPAEGIIVGLETDENGTELVPIMRAHRWERAHRVTFGAGTLAIKTVAA